MVTATMTKGCLCFVETASLLGARRLETVQFLAVGMLAAEHWALKQSAFSLLIPMRYSISIMLYSVGSETRTIQRFMLNNFIKVRVRISPS